MYEKKDPKFIYVSPHTIWGKIKVFFGIQKKYYRGTLEYEDIINFTKQQLIKLRDEEFANKNKLIAFNSNGTKTKSKQKRKAK